MPEERIQVHEVSIEGPHFASVKYGRGLFIYKAEVELTRYDEATVRFPPAAYPKDETPIEFSDDDLRAVLQLLLGRLPEVTGTTYLDDSGARKKVYSLKQA